MNSHSPMLLPDMMTSGSLASFQLFPEYHPSHWEICSICPFCSIAMYIVTTGTSTSPRLMQQYPLPTHNSLEKLDITFRDLLSAERVWMWRECRHRTRLASVHNTYTLSHLQRTGSCAHPFKDSSKSLFPTHRFFFSSVNPRRGESF